MPTLFRALDSFIYSHNLEGLKGVIESGMDVNTNFPPDMCAAMSVILTALVRHSNLRLEESLAVLKYILEKGADRNDVLKILDAGGPIPYQQISDDLNDPYFILQMKDLFKKY